ncbi:MAG: molybdopterin converting factor subunit 1 [Aquificae bacterium]|nr:molybdopterin converting factor subunit 1 [Aquificota bacterium]
MVRLLYFSYLKERLKKAEEELPFTGTVGELRKLLKEKYPQLADELERVRFAVNDEYAKDDEPIKDGDKIALIPPVSGG